MTDLELAVAPMHRLCKKAGKKKEVDPMQAYCVKCRAKREMKDAKP